jgi:hypothetical protein
MEMGTLPGEARRIVDRYVRHLDRRLPGRVLGLYVVGSTALGAYRPGRSDIDVVGVTDGRFGPDDLRRLRMVHVGAGAGSVARAVARGRLAIPGTVNGVFVAAEDVARPVTAIVPVASHVGHEFHAGKGFDVNPVVWKTLAERGIAVRGPEPADLGLDPEPGKLRDWNLANLDGYWAGWAAGVLAASGRARRRAGSRWALSWGTLGAPRLHCTIATGEVVSKEAAGDYALATFGDRWRPLVEEAVAYRLDRPSPGHLRDPVTRARETGTFVREVVRRAREL